MSSVHIPFPLRTLLATALLAVSTATAGPSDTLKECRALVEQEQYSAALYELSAMSLPELLPAARRALRFYLLGRCHEGLEELGHARAAYQKALETDIKPPADWSADARARLKVLKATGVEATPASSYGEGIVIDRRAKLRKGSKGRSFVKIPVWYATDRASTGDRKPDSYFGTERGILTYGQCTVSIPASHTRGEIERPAWWKMEFVEDPSRHMMIANLTEMSRTEFAESIREALAKDEERRHTFVFIHGFNRTFNISVLRTAQLFYDLKLPGIPVTYSWPSEESPAPLNYTRAGTTAEWTVPHLKEVLACIADETGSDRISIVAHSMGNRVLTKALVEFAKERDNPIVHEVILAAPDIDAEIFERDIVPAMQQAAERFTLYASSDDKALKLSKTVNGYPRAGDSGATLVVTPGLETVDATGLDTSLIGTGHFYYSTMQSILEDFRAIIIKGLNPAERKLNQRERNGHPYWQVPTSPPEISF